MKSFINKLLASIATLTLALLINSCSSGTCTTSGQSFLFNDYIFPNNIILSGANNYTMPAGQESYGQFILKGNSSFTINLYTDNPNIKIVTKSSLSASMTPTGSFLPSELQLNNNITESSSYLIIHTESQTPTGRYKLSLYADPIMNNSIESHTYLGYVWVNVTQAVYSTIYISNVGGVAHSSGVIGCSITSPSGRLVNCNNYTSESYFNNNLLSPAGIATTGDKLYILDKHGSALYPIWECIINTKTTVLSGCHGYAAESVGLTNNDLRWSQGISISGNKLYISAQNNTPYSAVIYNCELNSTNDISNCIANNISEIGTINAAPLATDQNNVFTLFHPVTTYLNTGTISCNSNVSDCSVESSANIFTPLSSLTGINIFNNNIILSGDNKNTTDDYIGTLRCDMNFSSCLATGPNLVSTGLVTAQFGINQGLVFIPLMDLNISAPSSKITICPILPNGEIMSECVQQDSLTITGLAIPVGVTFYTPKISVKLPQ